MPVEIHRGLCKPSVQLITSLAIESWNGQEDVLFLRQDMPKLELAETLKRWRDLHGLWIIVTSIAFADYRAARQAEHLGPVYV